MPHDLLEWKTEAAPGSATNTHRRPDPQHWLRSVRAVSQPSNERWLPVVGYEGLYEVSDHGRVRGMDRVVIRGNGAPQTIRGRVLAGKPVRGSHLQVALRRPGHPSDYKYVHALVMIAFVGPYPDGMNVCHNDGNPKNNHLSNLRYGTHTDNMRDMLKHGTHAETNKTHCPRNHPLAVPNLVPSKLKKRGYRDCLACSRARAKVRHNPELKSMFQKVADDYYSSIAGPRGG